ncbi:hypothetical protein ABW19_dt0200422 [Dactylella cylindrospora]|nr:hypothetical protein ABW19_dt0200422 [Dactylella cylindrospora]
MPPPELGATKEMIIGGLPPEKDPTSPHYVFHPEHERLSGISLDSITTPSLTPRLPAPIAYMTGLSGPFGRETFFMSAMRRRCELLGRPMTPVEMAVLGRYTTNMQTGTEWAGFFGMTGCAVRGWVTGLWPLENLWREALGIKKPGTGESPSDRIDPKSGVGGNGTASPGGRGAAQTQELGSKGRLGFLGKTLAGDFSSPFSREGMRNMVDSMTSKLESIPEDQRETRQYKFLLKVRDSAKAQLEESERLMGLRRKEMIQDLESRLEYMKSMKEQYRHEFAEKEMERMLEDLKKQEDVVGKVREAAEASGKAFEKTAADAPKEAPVRRVVVAAEQDSLAGLRTALRLGCWAVLGKYVFTALGITFLSMRSRGLEQRDERLQEYHHDKIQYARTILKEQMERARQPPDPTRQTGRGFPRQPLPPQRGSAGDTTPADDAQSLGGAQSETIFWGDLDNDDSESSVDATSKPSQTGESVWARARKEREEDQSPAERDRFSTPQSESTTINDTGNMSTWERIRQQTSSGFGLGGDKRVPGEPVRPGESWSIGNSDRERQLAKEQAQREFDEQLERERRGEGSDGLR